MVFIASVAAHCLDDSWLSGQQIQSKTSWDLNESATLLFPLNPFLPEAGCPQALSGDREGIQALGAPGQQQQPGSGGRKQLQSSRERETRCQLSTSHLVMSEEVEETETSEQTEYFHLLKQDVMRDLRNLDFKIKSKYKLLCVS